ncbi:sporulation regulator-like protein [Haloferax elongans ATCC BAA-1513]|uniref:Sporulation regulator-like protein n=1 Tax=Haloferax elongans ATCC BAA-1513 TaxID=1230453 RepID=M0HGZ4_HALEO|nr:GNAT family N-acetyltransferase [Haloferax elongans]ELZ83043.1 sporulation regulator-like protein [Haloferax elongans ATCC BAA-1513]
MRVTPASLTDLDSLTDMWVDLAAGQQEFGSHLRADANRSVVRESLARHLSIGGVLVARAEAEVGAAETRDEEEWVARRSDREDHPTDSTNILGFAMFDIESGSYEQDVTRGTISNLFVVPGHRGDGVGSELLAAAEDELREWGADIVALDVMAENENARKFYRRHGYQPHRVQLEKSMRNDTHSKEDR